MAAAKRGTGMDELRAVASVMREFGILHYKTAEMEVLLGGAPAVKGAKPEADPLAKKREFYRNQLGRDVSDEELGMLP